MRLRPYAGNRQDRVRAALAQSSGCDRDAWLRDEIDLPGFRLLSADFSRVDGGDPDVVIPCSLKIPRL